MISIGMVIYNRREPTVRAIRALEDTAKIPYELILVNNGSTQEGITELMASSFAVHKIWNPTNVGIAKAQNMAIAVSSFPYYMKLDNDTCLPPGWEILVEILQERGDIGLTAPRIPGNDSCVSIASNLDFRGHRLNFLNGGLGGTGLVLRTEELKKLGGFEEAFGLYGHEDADMQEKVRRILHKSMVRVESLVADHITTMDDQDYLVFKSEQATTNRPKLYDKWSKVRS